MPGDYSGLIAKTSAMHGRLLRKEELERLAEVASVNEAISFLSKQVGYEAVYKSHDEIAHRGQVEAFILNALYADYAKLFRFANQNQREALELVFQRYEIDILKICLKYVFIDEFGVEKEPLNWYFDKHTDFDVQKLIRAHDINEFIMELRGTPYEEELKKLQEGGVVHYGDFASHLDSYYFVTLWKQIKGMQNKKMKQVLQMIYGTQIDWLNIMGIYREKRYYHQSKEDMSAYSIPITYRLKKQELHAMREAGQVDEFLQVLVGSSYFKGDNALLQMEDEISYRNVIDKMYKRACKKFPISIAPILNYLHDKAQEIEGIITAFEGIRYSLDAREIKNLIIR
ncbi:V-type ATPase subunit [Lachnospiraceae bacterium ZAX-1]